MAMSRQEGHLYEFDPFRLDSAERQLVRDGAPVPLAPKAFDLLLTLVQNSGHLLEKDELMKLVWPEQFVEEGNLALNISILRKVLRDDHATRRYIETVPKRGYRFVADVRRVHADVAVETHAGRLVVVAGGETDAKAKVIDSLAVLPFVNVSADPNMEYLSDGITESIINSLAQLPNLRVMARSTVFRYKGKEANAREVGQELNVGAVLLGRMLLLDEHLIIRTELVDTADGRQLWGEQYNRKPADILAVQEEISREISGKLRSKLNNEERQFLKKHDTESIEAYQAYLRGRYFFNKRNSMFHALAPIALRGRFSSPGLRQVRSPFLPRPTHTF